MDQIGLQNTNVQKAGKLSIPVQLGDGSCYLYVDFEQILYLEAQSNYTLIYVEDKIEKKNVVKSSKTLKFYESKLCENGSFFRIHDSYIINLQKLYSYNKGAESYVTLMNKDKNEIKLKVSRNKKEEFGKIKTSKFPVVQFDEFIYVDINSILYLEASGDRTIFYFENNPPIISTKNLGYFETKIELLVRISDKHIVNLTKVTKYYKGNDSVILNTAKGLKVSPIRKEDLLRYFR